jgi:hypothetical protein
MVLSARDLRHKVEPRFHRVAPRQALEPLGGPSEADRSIGERDRLRRLNAARRIADPAAFRRGLALPHEPSAARRGRGPRERVATRLRSHLR